MAHYQWPSLTRFRLAIVSSALLLDTSAPSYSYLAAVNSLVAPLPLHGIPSPPCIAIPSAFAPTRRDVPGRALHPLRLATQTLRRTQQRRPEWSGAGGVEQQLHLPAFDPIPRMDKA
nr:unnamed protein product [Digitaria exilis]